MNNTIQIPLNTSKKRKREIIRDWCRQTFLIEKLANKFGLIFFIACSILLSVAVSLFGVTFGILIAIVLIAIPVVVGLVIYPQFGIIVYLSMSFSIMFLLRYGISFPLGTLMDGMLVLFILGLFIQQKKKPDWAIFKSPVSLWILIWIGYNFLEFGNPTTESRTAWVYTIRGMALVTMMYFIFLYNIRTKAYMRFVFKWWLGFMLIAALYAFKQEYLGFYDFEEAYNHSEGVPLLLFIAGHWRKYSVFSDPVTFAYNMSIASLLCIGLLTGPLKVYQRIILISLIAIMLVGMMYSGTRGAFPLVPASLILYAILNYSKKILIFTAVAAVFVVGLIFMPTSNQNILRFQSAFRPNDDPSYIVRKLNQARIKPYVWVHPLGGGLGSTGEWGKKFAPGSFLSTFPPDSGYVRTTVELGWIGLTIFCIMIFTIIKTGIDNYYKIRDPELKSYSLGMVLMVFAWNIANFPQEALVQYPSNVIFYLTVAMINVCLRIDQEQQKSLVYE